MTPAATLSSLHPGHIQVSGGKHMQLREFDPQLARRVGRTQLKNA